MAPSHPRKRPEMSVSPLSVFAQPVSRRRRLSLALLVGGVLGLAGCSGVFSREDPRACPKVRIDATTAQVTLFAPGPGRDITDQILTATVTGLEGTCSYDKTGVLANMNVTFEVDLGPAAPASRQASFTYFVALPDYFPAAGAKQVYTVAVTFPPNVNRIVYRDEKLSVRLPLNEGETAGNKTVYVGFQLTADELRFNRDKTAPRR